MTSLSGSTQDNVELIRRDGTRAMTADLAMGTHNITALLAGTAVDHAVNKAQLDAATGTLVSLAALSVVGRASGTSGAAAAITATADGQVLRRSGGALGWGAVDLADSDAVTGALPLANLPSATASSVLGRSAASSGAYADIPSSADGQVLRRGSSGVIGFGAIDLASTAAVAGLLAFANLAGLAGLSVLGRAPNSSGVLAAITGTDGQVLRVSGTALGFGTLVAANLTDGTITLAKLADGTAASVIGRVGATAGAYADIASSADGQVLRRLGGTLAWGAVDLADSDAITGLLPFGNLASASATSVLGRAGGTTGVLAPIAATADGQYLQRAGGALVWGTLGTATVSGGTATGQVYINTAGNVPAWGAVDLADSDAVTGLLPHANVASLAGLSVFGRAANTTGVMAAITGADGQVLRVSGTTLGFGTIALAGLAGGSAVGQVLVNTTGNVPAWGAVDLADSDAVTGLLPFANVASLAGLSVFGRSLSSSGVMAAITGADGQVLRVSGTTLGFGAISAANITDGSITLIKLANATASSVLGRSAATAGVYADITSSADGQVLRRGASGVIAFGAVDLADGDAVTGLLPFANITSGAANSLFGRAAGSSGVMASIAASLDGQVLRMAGGTLAFGALDLSDTDAVTGTLPLASQASLAGLSVPGRSATTTGVMAAITGTTDLVLRVASDGLSLGFGTIATGGYANNSVTLAKVAQASAAASVLGRSAASLGNYADIASSADGQVLRRSGGTLAWGAVDLADADAITGLLPFANIASLAGLSVFGRGSNTTGVMAAITGADGQVLRVSGTTLGFGTIVTANITDAAITPAKLADLAGVSVLGRSANSTGVTAAITATATGQVLRYSGSVIGWGALDLADADALTGQMPLANLTPSGTNGRVLVTASGAASWSSALGNDTDGFTYNGAVHTFKIASSNVLSLDSNSVDISVATVQFVSASVNPSFGCAAISTAGPFTATTTTLYGQDATGTGATVGGIMRVRAGNSTNGVGGILELHSGDGATADGALNLYTGSTAVYQATATTNTLGHAAITDIELETSLSGTNGVAMRAAGLYLVHSASPASKTSGSGIFTATGGVAIGFATNSVAYLGYRTVALGADHLTNVSLFDNTRTFDGGQGVVGIRNANVEPAVPSSGGYIFGDPLTGALAWVSRLSTNDHWQLGPATTYARKFFTPACGTTNRAIQTQITSQTLSTLPSDCSGYIVVLVSVKDSSGQLGTSKAEVLFHKASGTLNVDTTGGFLSGGGLVSVSASGASLVVSITPTGTSLRSHECKMNVEYTVVP